MQPTPIHSLAVFCGSKYGVNQLFAEHAVALGKIMVKHEVTLIYGGGNVGLMGTIADTVMQHGGRAIGVIPQVLVEWERQHTSLSELFVVDDMHTRKKKMYELCDAAIILPGGFGTLDELFEMVTWNQLSIHDKHIFILNSGDYYKHLIAHIAHMQQENFLYEAAYQRLSVIDEPGGIVKFLAS
ncbi:MAG: TIGR00730 family Rossman fold protein [Chitinophagaceae bacterium]|nr:TIGR00730 family Rossman fold protein [Chitinophagaceae bacterium]